MKKGYRSVTVETLSPKNENYLGTYRFYEQCHFKPLFELNTYGPDDEDRKNNLILINDFRKTFLETFFVTLACFFTGYLLAGLPTQIPWNKLLPTLLIVFPVYGTRFAAMTWGGNGIGEQMDKLFFKTLYVIGITWLAWKYF